MTTYTAITDGDLASGALYDKVNDIANALNAGKLERTALGIRKASTAYASGAIVTCEYHGDLLLKCTTGGTTGIGALDTSGALSAGSTISDGTVVWTVVTNGTVRSVNGYLPDSSGAVTLASETSWDLLDYKWTDRILNDIRWTRADNFSWQSGSVYASAYQHLVDDIDGKSTTTETVHGHTITYYLADDEHKIVPANYISDVEALYNDTGVEWYYILDTTNERFKLPRVDPTKKEALLFIKAKGNGMALGFDTGFTTPAGYEHLGLRIGDGNQSALLTATNGNYGKNIGEATTGSGTANGKVGGLAQDPDYSGVVAELSDADTIYAGQKHLYFYVGYYTTSALAQTAGLNAESFNAKADKDLGNITSNGKKTAISWTLPDYSSGQSITLSTANTWTEWTAPCDCFVAITASATGAICRAQIAKNSDGSNVISGLSIGMASSMGCNASANAIIGKNETVYFRYNTTLESAIYYPLKGAL